MDGKFLTRLPTHSSLRRFRIWLGIYCVICVAFFVVRTAHWKQVNDPAQIHYACFLMDHGMAPYRDLLEINMPGIYLVNWSVMHTLGGGSVAWRVFDLGLMALAGWAMIAIARPYDWLGGALGATLFILFHGKDGAGQQGQRDLIIAVLLLCAYVFLFEAFRRRRPGMIFFFALCGSIASTIKPTPLPFILLLLWAAALRWRREGQPILRPVLTALLGMAIPFLVVGIFLITKHSLSSFWYLLRVELPFYQNLGRMAWPTLVSMLASASLRILALVALAVAVMKREWWNWEGKLLVAGILFGMASFLAQGKGLPYHRYPMLAFLFLWIGIQFITALESRGRVAVVAAAGLAFSLILLPIYLNTASRREWAPQYGDALANDLNRLGGPALSGHVQCLDMPADCDATLYRMRLVQSTGLFYDYLIFGSEQQQVIRDERARFWQEFQQNTPRVLIVGRGLFPHVDGYEKLASWPLFEQELEKNYFLYEDRTFPWSEAGQRAYRIYVERGSQVASGLGSNVQTSFAPH